jgi:quercetin dioxygenase-like cupin family protein
MPTRPIRETAAHLALAAAPAAPPPSLRARLMDRVRSDVQVWKTWDAGSAANVVRRESGNWTTAKEGVRVKQLSVDPARHSVTMLVRMDPGASWPAHRHGGHEQCFVLEGELHVGDDTTLRAGDFQAMDTDTTHPVQWTQEGCLLLIVSSQRDVLLA